MSLINLTIPNDWQPRPHQQMLYDNFCQGWRYTRGCAVWHRRAGEDSVALNLTARDMFKRIGTYWHLFPEQAQARRAVWNGIDAQGRRIIDQVLPPALRRLTSSQDMLIETVNGSVWQMAGSDNFDSLVGSNPVGVVFSEWSLVNPAAWDYIRPDQIDAERLAIMSDGKIRQEFGCSFEAQSDEQLISYDLVAAAVAREPRVEQFDEKVIGVDVARFGNDKSVIYFR